MLPSKYITTAITVFIVSMIMISVKSVAQTITTPDRIYYVCAAEGFQLSGPTGFDSYLWTENGVTISGADSSQIQIPALTAAIVGNTYVTKTYHLSAQETDGSSSEESTFIVYILPKMQLSIAGYLPPYCENLSHNIALSAHINGGSGSSALVLPTGVSVQYTWLVVADTNSNWNAAITGATSEASAQVITPATSFTDNNYTLKIAYTYPASVNINTDVVGDCGDTYTQNVHADPAPQAPTINYQLL